MMTEKAPESKIITIPNLLTFFRLFLIPFIVWSLVLENDGLTVGLLAVSGITDVLDGIIARKSGQVTNLGKILDPIADKMTQGITLICLLSRFPAMWMPLGLMILKEVASGVAVLICIRKTNQVSSSRWHGKLTTVLLYSMMYLHLLWQGMPEKVSHILILITTLVMILSFILYFFQSIGTIRKASAKACISESEKENP